MKDKKVFTEKESELISFLYAMGCSAEDINMVFLNTKDSEEREILLEYLYHKGKYSSYSDVLRFSFTIRRSKNERHQYMPHKMFVRFIKETTDELNNGDYYQVDTIFGVKEKFYYMMNEKDEMKEYPASDFILLRPSRIVYEGKEEDGLVPNKEYDVVKQKGMSYVLSNGQEVSYFLADEIEFVPAEDKELAPIEHEKLLQMVRGIFEFGDMHIAYGRMTDKTVYESIGQKKEIIGRDNILEYIEKIQKNRLEEKLFTHVDYATVTEHEPMGHTLGERFLMMFDSDDSRYSIFVYDDGTHITKIVVSDGWPSYCCDAKIQNKLGLKKVKCPLLEDKEISEDDCYDVCLVANRMLKGSAIPDTFTQKENFREICINCPNHNMD